MSATYQMIPRNCVCRSWDRGVPEIRATRDRHHKRCRMQTLAPNVAKAIVGKTPEQVTELMGV